MTPTETVKGLPAGVELVRIGLAEANDYEIVDGVIYHGPRPGAASGVIVKPADGYMFQKAKFDMHAYSETFAPTKIITPTSVTVHAVFTVATQQDLDEVKAGIEALKALPGVKSIEDQ